MEQGRIMTEIRFFVAVVGYRLFVVEEKRYYLEVKFILSIYLRT